MVDGSFTDDELIAAAERAVGNDDVDPEEAIDWLEDRALLFRLPEPEGRCRTALRKAFGSSHACGSFSRIVRGIEPRSLSPTSASRHYRADIRTDASPSTMPLSN